MNKELSRNHPVILCGSFKVKNVQPETRASDNGGHCVVAYGRQGTKNYIVHYGWKGYGKVYLNSGVIGSSAQFWLN